MRDHHSVQHGTAFVSAWLIAVLVFSSSSGVLFTLEATAASTQEETQDGTDGTAVSTPEAATAADFSEEEETAEPVAPSAPRVADATSPETDMSGGNMPAETASDTVEGINSVQGSEREADGVATSGTCASFLSPTATTSDAAVSPGLSSADPVEDEQSCIGASVTHISFDAPGTTTSTTDASLSPANVPEDNISAHKVTIVSGKAIAVANILNILNTNIINSEGRVIFANLTKNIETDIDLRAGGSVADEGCTLISCAAGTETIVNILNDAFIKNLVRVEAMSGGNLVEDAGTGTITTGDAYAALNLVNVANVNFIDASYLLAALNVFGSLYGDIVFPSLARLLDGGPTPTSAVLTGEGSVENTLAIDAATDGNSAFASSSTIATGDAFASGNVFSKINTSLLGDASVAVLLKVHGKWFGEIAGGADKLSMSANGAGFYVISASGGGGSSGDSAAAFVNGTNTLRIENDVAVVAQTGKNAVSGAEHALITTGDAHAGANIVNVANTNVIGRNWLVAIINIFGDFAGDIAFGRPDLWMGVRAEAPAYTTNGSEILYTLSVINNGDAEATAVTVTDRFDKEHIDIIASDLAYHFDEEGNLRWDIGTLLPGMGTQFTYRGRVKHAGPITWIVNAATAVGAEKDNNIEDNTDGVAILANPAGYGGLGGGEVWTPPSAGEVHGAATQNAGSVSMHALDVARVSATSTVFAGETSTQRVVITNNGPDAPGTTFTDELRDPAGNVIHRERWDLGTVLAGEEITLTYDVLFGDHAEGGTHLLSSVLERTGSAQIFEANGAIVLLRRSPLAVGESSLPLIPIAAIERAPASLPSSEPEPPLIVAEHEHVPIAPFVRVAYANEDGDEMLSAYYRMLGAVFAKIAIILLGIAMMLATLSRVRGGQDPAARMTDRQ